MKKQVKKMTRKQDDAYDKKHGIKEGSKKDMMMDKKHGVKDEMQVAAKAIKKGMKGKKKGKIAILIPMKKGVKNPSIFK